MKIADRGRQCRCLPMSRGFTLVEMLVVIAIILILVGALMPALEKAQYQAIQSKCISQHRQIYVGISCYVNDYDGWYRAGRFANTVCQNEPAQTALLYNGKYIRVVDMFYDPGAKEYWNYASPKRFISQVPTELYGQTYCDYSIHCGWSYFGYEKLEKQRDDCPAIIACAATKRYVSGHWWIPGGGPQPHVIKNRVGGVNTTFHDGAAKWINEKEIPNTWNKPWGGCDAIWNQYNYGSFWHWMKTHYRL